jgi:hypothetical protein
VWSHGQHNMYVCTQGQRNNPSIETVFKPSRKDAKVCHVHFQTGTGGNILYVDVFLAQGVNGRYEGIEGVNDCVEWVGWRTESHPESRGSKLHGGKLMYAPEFGERLQHTAHTHIPSPNYPSTLRTPIKPHPPHPPAPHHTPAIRCRPRITPHIVRIHPPI